MIGERLKVARGSSQRLHIERTRTLSTKVGYLQRTKLSGLGANNSTGSARKKRGQASRRTNHPTAVESSSSAHRRPTSNPSPSHARRNPGLIRPS